MTLVRSRGPCPIGPGAPRQARSPLAAGRAVCLPPARDGKPLSRAPAGGTDLLLAAGPPAGPPVYKHILRKVTAEQVEKAAKLLTRTGRSVRTAV